MVSPLQLLWWLLAHPCAQRAVVEAEVDTLNGSQSPIFSSRTEKNRHTSASHVRWKPCGLRKGKAKGISATEQLFQTFFACEAHMGFLLQVCSAEMIQAEPVLTSQGISLVHELGTEQDHPSSSVLLEKAPHLVPGKRIQPSGWLIQEQDLQKGWEQPFHTAGAIALLLGLVFPKSLRSWRPETRVTFYARAAILGAVQSSGNHPSALKPD